MMPVCPVCGAPLIAAQHTWYCKNKHSFDVARQGYVNLLTVDKKHSVHPGDTKEMVAARKAFLDEGFYVPIAEKLVSVMNMFCADAKAILDTGCGEGYYLSYIQRFFPLAELWGIDISKDAVRYASVRSKEAKWLTGTAAALPFSNGSFDTLLSMFALTVENEYARVLRDGGIFIQVLAGEEHLMGLKNIIYPEIIRKEKYQSKSLDGFELVCHDILEFPLTIENNMQLRNLLSMTPHYWRISREGAARLEKTDRLDDIAQVVFNVYRRI